MAEKRVSVRFGSDGGNRLKAEFRGVGEAGAKGFARIRREMEIVNARLAALGRRLRRAFRLAAVAVAGAVSLAVRSSLRLIDAQAKLAQSLGTTAASVQVLQRAGDLAGVSLGEIQQASIQLTRRLSQAAAGTGPAVDALDRLGLSAAALSELPLDERIATIQDAILRLIPAAQQAAVASQLFGDRAGLVFSRIDSATLRQASEDVRDFGVAVSEQDADQIERTNDALSRLGLVGRGVANRLAVALAPALQAAADKIAEMARPGGPIARAIAAFGDLAAAIVDNVGRVVAITQGLAVALAGRFLISVGLATAGVRAFAGSLVILRGALLRTGFGAIVVGLGELIFRLSGAGSEAEASGGKFATLRESVAQLALAQALFDRVLTRYHQDTGPATRAELIASTNEVIANAKATLQATEARIAFNEARLSGVSAEGLAAAAAFPGAAATNPVVAMAARANELLAQAATARTALANARQTLQGLAREAAVDPLTAAAGVPDFQGVVDQINEVFDNLRTGADSAGGAARKAGEDAADGADKAATGWARAVETLRDFAAQARDVGAGIGDVLVDAFQSAENAFRSFAEGGKLNFKGLIGSILADLATLTFRANVLGPIANALAGAFGGLVPAARGNVLSGGRVVPFASGGVIDRPTLFPLRGGTGLAGEAGPEAILPLKRIGGRLGVETIGGGQVQVVVRVADDGGLRAAIEGVSGNVSARTVAAYDGTILNRRLGNPDPLRRG